MKHELSILISGLVFVFGFWYIQKKRNEAVGRPWYWLCKLIAQDGSAK